MKRYRFAFLTVFKILIPLLFVSGCATTKGRISGGNYHAPLSNFVMPLPKGVGLRIQDNYDKDGGMVSFHDDFGNNQGVTYLRLPANADSVHADPTKRDAAYRGFVHDYAMPSLFRPVSSQSKVVAEEFLGAGPERAYFAVVVIPEGSTLMDLKTKKRLDSFRGVLVFDEKGFMYMLSSEMSSVFEKTDPSSMDDKRLKAAQNTLQHMRKAISFQ